MILLRSAAFNAAFFGLTTLMVLPGPLVEIGRAHV